MTAQLSRAADSRFAWRRVAAAVIVIALASILPLTTHPARGADGPLRSEGEFLTGWYDTLSGAARLPAIRAEGMNSVMPYDDGADALAYLDAAREAGVKVFVEIDRDIVRTGDTDAIRAWVAQYETHPSVAGWYLADEPSTNVTLGPLSAATAEQLYHAVKAEDPSHPVAIAFGVNDDLTAYRYAYDIAMYDEYPARLGQPEFTGLGTWKHHIQQRATSTYAKQGFVPVIQAFTTGSSGPTQYYRLPTAAEARYMTYTAVQAGATGIFYWTRYRSTLAFIDDVIEPLTSELTRLGPALKNGALLGVATVQHGGPSAVARAYRDPSSGRYTLVVVNHGAQPVDATLSVSTSLGLTTAHAADDTVTAIVDGTLAVSLQPYEARTYDLSSPPTITDVANQTLDEDTTATVPVTIGDDNTHAQSLVLSATSSDQTLLPDANITVGGSGADRTLAITPSGNLSGTATVTLTVTDGDETTASDDFDVVVAPVNDAPTISNITEKTTPEATTTATTAFTIDDVETPAATLTLSGSSSQPTLVSDSKIVFGGTGADRTIAITPNAGSTGSAVITVTVEDESGATAIDTLVLTVTAKGATLAVSDASIVEGNSGTRSLSFAVTRSGTSATSSRVDFKTSNGTASSSSDYSSTRGTMTFTANGTKTVLVPIKGDRTREPNESVVLTLSNPSNAGITDGSAIGTIVNDD